MASDSLTEALDALETALDQTEGADVDASAEALAGPVKALNAAAREALR
ncbi:MAG: hypothetical protein KF779_10025 [Hyphomonadaceae bacterium]|nr:hypothetical protein [Hyphomonadaceae bacterium]